jgi:hypothetical protein
MISIVLLNYDDSPSHGLLNTQPHVTTEIQENCVGVQLQTENFTHFFLKNIFSMSSALHISMLINGGQIWTILTI